MLNVGISGTFKLKTIYLKPTKSTLCFGNIGLIHIHRSRIIPLPQQASPLVLHSDNTYNYIGLYRSNRVELSKISRIYILFTDLPASFIIW